MVWYCCWKKKSNQYSLKLGNNCSNFMFGFGDPSKLSKTSANYSGGQGFYWYPSGNTLYGTGSTGSLSGGDCNQGTVYGMKYDPKKGEISIYKAGKLVQVGWKGIKKLKNLCPVLDAYNQNSTYEFCKGKYKK